MNRIKEALQERGITQVWLAKKLNKTFKIVNGYACNRNQPPLTTLHKIADILKVDVKELLN